MSSRIAIVVLAFTCFLVGACRPKKPLTVDYNQELPPGQVALRKISVEQYPDFTIPSSNLVDVIRAIDHSLSYMSAPSSKGFYPYLDIDHARAVASLNALKALLEQRRAEAGSPGGMIDLNQAIRDGFEVYQSYGAPKPEGGGYTDSVLFTGYFTPIYQASLTRTGEFQHPLYKRPADLMTNESTGQSGLRAPTGTIVPYHTRQEIESDGILAGQELVFLKSRWEAYVITIQGSARLRLPDGQIYEVGYAGNNGYEYTSPGKQMVEDGVITRDQLSLKGLRAHFQTHPEDMDRYLHLNQRYVFFTERKGGPFGSLNVPVTPFASIATDKTVYPRAMPAFIKTTVPTSTGSSAPFHGLLMDQDTGGAIRAAGRGDIYMGVGDQAEDIAGQQLHTGQLYYLAVKQ